MSSARRPRTTYKNYAYTFTPHLNMDQVFYGAVTHVTHSHLLTHLTHDPWPMTRWPTVCSDTTTLYWEVPGF